MLSACVLMLLVLPALGHVERNGYAGLIGNNLHFIPPDGGSIRVGEHDLFAFLSSQQTGLADIETQSSQLSGRTNNWAKQRIASAKLQCRAQDNGFDAVMRVPAVWTQDWESFEIDGTHYLVAANLEDQSNSTLYVWDTRQKMFVAKQVFPTLQAHDWEYFEINGMHYLALANYAVGYGPVTPLNSTIFRWDSNTTQFHAFQQVLTHGADNWSHFVMNGRHYLAVSNTISPSQLLVWNETDLGDRFDVYQNLTTDILNHDVKYFMVDDMHFLAVAREFGSSYLMTWNEAQAKFVKNTFIQISIKGGYDWGGHDWEPFVINGTQYLLLANYYITTAKSALFKLQLQTPFPGFTLPTLELVQTFASNGAADWEHFVIDNKHYVALANTPSSQADVHNSASDVFVWDTDASQFRSIQRIVTNTQGASAFEHFEINHVHYLAMALHDPEQAKIFAWNGVCFV
eukprot:m.361437 g.361437  ORF g.361437 m.361437 type:complete len:458 (-) comp19589_c0_seq1:1125-2498(-)